MIESIYGTPVTVERDGDEVYLDINKMDDVLLEPVDAVRLADQLKKVAYQIMEANEDAH